MGKKEKKKRRHNRECTERGKYCKNGTGGKR
jgi:hypothetical protein